MSPGVAFLYAGLTRNISTNHMLTLVFATMAVITVQWFLFGFSLSFSETGSSFIGDFNMGALVNVQFAPLSLTAPTVPALAFALYQMQFATVTGTIVFGSVADRIRFMPALLFIFVWTTLVYNPVTYVSWREGEKCVCE